MKFSSYYMDEIFWYFMHQADAQAGGQAGGLPSLVGDAIGPGP